MAIRKETVSFTCNPVMLKQARKLAKSRKCNFSQFLSGAVESELLRAADARACERMLKAAGYPKARSTEAK